MKYKRVLVTGGAGFIGSHVVEDLVRRGHTVRVFDNFSSGRREYLAGVMADVEIIEGNILDASALTKAATGVDAISHHAAQLEILKCLADPEEDLRSNTVGTLNVLQAAVTCDISRVVNVSSACVYGQAQHMPQSEHGHPTNPNWAYGVSKLAAEKYCHVFQETHGLECTSLRYAIIYGPREWCGRVVTMFLRRILAGKPPIVFGDGAQVRDFTYVSDVVDLHARVLDSRNAYGKVYNVSTGKGTTVRELAEMVLKIAGMPGSPQFLDVQPGQAVADLGGRVRLPVELQAMTLDNTSAQTELGWVPRVPLEEGLQRELEWAAAHSEFWEGFRI